MKRVAAINLLTVIVYLWLSSVPVSALPDGAVARLGMGKVANLTFSPDGAMLAVATLIGRRDVVLSAVFSPDGSLLASGSADDTILLWEVTPLALINQPPVASFSYSPENPAANMAIVFDASAAFDPDGQIVSYEWDFGDGSSGKGKIAEHSYSSKGLYTVTLKVTDNKGKTYTIGTQIIFGIASKADIQVVNLLPADDEIKGWRGLGFYNEARDLDSFYDLIGGGVVVFIDHGFVSAVFHIYKNRIGEGGEGGVSPILHVRIYNQGNATNAKAVYDRVAAGISIPWYGAGIEARIDENGLASYLVEFWQGNLFVEVIVEEKTDKALGMAKLFASQISSKIESRLSVTPQGIDQDPLASFSFSPLNPSANTQISFDASSSHDSDGQIVLYEWDFGDGSVGAGETVTHFYSLGGSYTVRLTVADNEGARNSHAKTIIIGVPKSKEHIATLRGHTDEVTSVAFSPDGRTLASASGETIRLWDVASREDIAIFGEGGYDIAFSPDGRLLACGRGDVELWDVENRKIIIALEGSGTDMLSVAFSPDGKLVAAGSGRDFFSGNGYISEGVVNLWNVENRELIATLGGHTDYVYSIAFSPDGRLLASGSGDSTIRLWDVESKESVATFEGHYTVAFSPDGELLAFNSRDGIDLWDLWSRESVATLEADTSDIPSIAFSPDGRLLASSAYLVRLPPVKAGEPIRDVDDIIELWGVSSREHIATLRGHIDRVTSIAFSSDGELLASGSEDKTIMLWDITLLLLPPSMNQAPVASFSFFPESPATNREITFDASSSSDLDGQIVSYEWDFGDGFTASDINVSHSYNKANAYTVTLTITDDEGDVSRKSVNIPISLYPSEEISVPDIGPPTLDFANADDSKRVEMYKVIQQVFSVERVKARHQGSDEDHLFNCMDSLLRQLDPQQRDGDLSITDMVRDGALTEGEELRVSVFGEIASAGIYLLTGIPAPFLGEGIKLLAFEIGETLVLSDIHYVVVNYPTIGRMEIIFRPSQNKMLVNIYLECSVDQNIFMIIPIEDDHLGVSWLDYISSLMWAGVTRPPEVLVREPQPEIEDVQIIGLHSPAELRVHDSRGQITGLVQGEIRNEIPGAYYYDETIVIFDPSDSYRYEVVGTDTDTYGLTIFSVADGKEAAFAATDIPTTTVTRHQYVIDWEALSNGEEGVTLQIDADGDGIFEKTAVSDNELTKDEYDEIVEPDIKGDVNDDGSVRSNDAVLALRIAAGIMEPTEYQKRAADMNDDGKIRSNDAMLILRKAAGLAAPGKDSIINSSGQITVALAEFHGVAGENITVPVNIDYNAYGLAAGDISIAYDPAVLHVVDVSSELGGSLVSNISEPGVVRIAFAVADRLSDRTIAELQFKILSDDTSPLTLQNVELYQSDASPIESRKIDGKFTSWAIPPERSALLQNFPNSFNPDTWIPYQLAEDIGVTIRIYSVAGQLVRTLNLGHKPVGIYISKDRAAYWNGHDDVGEPVGSGVYFYTFEAGKFSQTRKMAILR